MSNTESYSLYHLHKSLGVIVGFAIIVRLAWRTVRPWESSARGMNHEKLVKRVHITLLTLLVAMPLTGLSLSRFGGYGVSLFGLQLIPNNYDELGKVIPYNSFIAEFGYIAHELAGYVLSALLGIHILAALKHHYIDKDSTLVRMLSTTWKSTSRGSIKYAIRSTRTL